MRPVVRLQAFAIANGLSIAGQAAGPLLTTTAIKFSGDIRGAIWMCIGINVMALWYIATFMPESRSMDLKNRTADEWNKIKQRKIEQNGSYFKYQCKELLNVLQPALNFWRITVSQPPFVRRNILVLLAMTVILTGTRKFIDEVAVLYPQLMYDWSAIEVSVPYELNSGINFVY